MYNCTYNLRYSDFKDYQTIKHSAVMDIIQDVAIKHSNELGYNLKTMREAGLAWMLQGIKVHFEKPVAPSMTIDVETAVKGMRGTSSERGTFIYCNGQLVAKAVANWFIFDLSRGRPGRIPAEMAEVYGTHDFGDDFFSYKKPETQDAEVLYSVRVSNKEIDTNDHLNNQKSSEILMDALPFDYFFTDMTVYFKRPALLGDILELCMTKLDNGYYVHLQTLEKEVCVAAVFECNL